MEKFPNSTESKSGTLDRIKDILSSWKFLTPAALAALIGGISGSNEMQNEAREARIHAIQEAIRDGSAEQIPTAKIDALGEKITELYASNKDLFNASSYKIEGVEISGLSSLRVHDFARFAGMPGIGEATVIINESDPEKLDRAYIIVTEEAREHIPGMKNHDRTDFVYFEGNTLLSKDYDEMVQDNQADKKYPYTGEKITQAVFCWTENGQTLVNAIHLEVNEDSKQRQEFDIQGKEPNTIIHADHITEMMDHDLELINRAIEELKAGKAETH